MVVEMIGLRVQFLNWEEARLRFSLASQLFHCDLDVLLHFDFGRYPHVLTIANRYVLTAIDLVIDEFTQNYGRNGLLQDEFRVEDSDLTVHVTNIEVSDYYERNGDEETDDDDDDDYADEDDNNVPMPQCREPLL